MKLSCRALTLQAKKYALPAVTGQGSATPRFEPPPPPFTHVLDDVTIHFIDGRTLWGPCWSTPAIGLEGALLLYTASPLLSFPFSSSPSLFFLTLLVLPHLPSFIPSFFTFLPSSPRHAAQSDALAAGVYTVVASTFTPGQLGSFILKIMTSVRARPRPARLCAAHF